MQSYTISQIWFAWANTIYPQIRAQGRYIDLLRKKDTKRKEKKKKEGYSHKDLLVRQFTQVAVFNFCLNDDFLFQQSAQKI